MTGIRGRGRKQGDSSGWWSQAWVWEADRPGRQTSWVALGEQPDLPGPVSSSVKGKLCIPLPWSLATKTQGAQGMTPGAWHALSVPATRVGREGAKKPPPASQLHLRPSPPPPTQTPSARRCCAAGK